MELLRFCKFGLCTLRKDNPFFKAKYDYARDSDFEITGFKCEEKLSQNILTVSVNGVMNRFYLFGGKDESSASLIQGMTLSGVLFDEVALMPRSFVEQALARCSVSGSRFWFNCNPEFPEHWFYREWIKK